MTDEYTACFNLYKLQLQTLNTSYFPANTGRAAGWQVSENDTVVMEGGDYFVTLRPGSFIYNPKAGVEDNEWHVLTTLYMRYMEFEGLWDKFRVFRSSILNLPKTAPLKGAGIQGTRQRFLSLGDAGYLVSQPDGAYLNFVVQTLDCVVPQRVLTQRAF
jgi:hypothetical protein